MDFEYCDEYLRRVVDNRATQDTFLLCHLFSYIGDLKKVSWIALLHTAIPLILNL